MIKLILYGNNYMYIILYNVDINFNVREWLIDINILNINICY